MSQRKPDYYYYKAKDGGFQARSVFKLEEIDKKYRLFKSGQKILDLGASPGSWMQYISDRIGKNGQLLGVDLNSLKIVVTGNTEFWQMSALDLRPNDVRTHFKTTNLDAVVSDMAPKTTGYEVKDHQLSIELCQQAFDLSRALLKPGGFFICKLFQGSDSPMFLKEVKSAFGFVKTQKPQASRKESREVFVVATDYMKETAEK